MTTGERYMDGDTLLVVATVYPINKDYPNGYVFLRDPNKYGDWHSGMNLEVFARHVNRGYLTKVD